MKKSTELANYLTLRLSMVFISILFVWSVVYFFVQMNEIYDGIDEGLNNLKQELILEANSIPQYMESVEKYEPINLIIEKIPYEEAVGFKETYTTSKIFFSSEEEHEEVRMLITAFYCQMNNQYYKVKIFTSTVETDDMIKSMLYLLLSLWIVLSIVLVIATKKIISNTNRPFYSLLNKLNKFHLDEIEMPDFPETTISEYSALNESVKQLLQDNIDTYSEQKSFIENATHELQTPVAIAKGKIELMMNDESLSPAQLKELNSILNTLDRVKRLNASLLLLSKIRNKQFVTNVSIDFVQLFKDVLDEFEALTEFKEILIEQEVTGVPAFEMNYDLAFILVNNLVKNAIIHNVNNGFVKIIFKDDSIAVVNSGQPIPDGVNIFDRYTSGTSNSQSVGLGLSIVKSIADRYKIKISHIFTDGKHMITLKFK